MGLIRCELCWIPVGVAVASVVAWLLYRSSYVPDAARAWSFAAVLSGDFAINGFRNRDLQGKLYPAAAKDAADSKRRTHRTSRLIAKLRGHGLITRIKNSRLYRLTARGLKAMWPALRFRRIDFPAAYNAA